MIKEPVIRKFNVAGEQAEVIFEPLKPSDSLKFLMYLGRFAGNGISGIVGGKASLKELSGLKDGDNLDDVAKALSKALMSLDDDETIDKLNLLLKSASYKGEALFVDHFVFQSDLTLLFKMAKISLEVNYKGFFKGISGNLEKLKGTLEILKRNSNQSPETHA